MGVTEGDQHVAEGVDMEEIGGDEKKLMIIINMWLKELTWKK